MAEDSSIVFRVDADDKAAQKRLDSLRRDIEKLGKSLDKTNTQHNGLVDALSQAKTEAKQTAAEIEAIQRQMAENASVLSGQSGSVDLEEFNARKQAQAELTVELKQQQAIHDKQVKSVEKIAAKEEQVRATLEQQTAQLQQLKSDAGEVERTVASQAANAMPQLKAAMEQANSSIRKGFKSILRWGFGIRSTFVLIRRLKAYLKEAVTAFAEHDAETKANIDGLKSALQQLKLSWGAAFAPILNAVAPLLRTLISWLTAAANAVARFFAVLGGKTSYKKAVANNNSLAGSYGGVGDAAEEAEKQIMGFDEINKLSEEKTSGGGGGGGGAGSAYDTVEEAIDMDSFAARLAFAVNDVFFDWEDLTAEQIAEKCLAGFIGLGGAIIGGMVGGAKGAVIGLTVGLALGTALDATIFNFDGELSKTEFVKCLITAAGFVAGGAIGFLAGGPVGAMLGASVGLYLSFKLNKTLFNAEGGVNKESLINLIKKAFGTIFKFVSLGPNGFLANITAKLSFSLADKFDFHPFEAFKNMLKSYFQPFIDKWTSSGKEAANSVGFNVVMGILDGIGTGVKRVLGVLWEYLVKPIIDEVKSLLGIASPSTVFAEIGVNIIDGLWKGISDTAKGFFAKIRAGTLDKVQTIQNLVLNSVDRVKQGIADKFNSIHNTLSNTISKIRGLMNFTWSLPRPRIPHIGWTWDWMEAAGISIPIPNFKLEWYAKGGIFDTASVIGVGEKGREAVLPLDRNTGWIKDLADQIVNAMGSRYGSSLSGLSAVASGRVVPPMATSGGSGLDAADIANIVAGVLGAGGQGQEDKNRTVIFNVNGREFFRATWSDQQAVAREHGISLITT